MRKNSGWMTRVMFARMASLLAILGILIIPLCSGCATIGLEENKISHTENCSISHNTAVAVQNSSVNGDVHVETWGKDYVELTWTKSTVWDKSELDKVDVKVTHAEGKLDVEARQLSKDAKVSVNYDIKLPKSALLDEVATTDGNIKITGTTGDAVVTTRIGSVFIYNASGYLNVTAQRGKIHLEGTTGGAKLTTSEDAIEVLNADGDITAFNGHGAITVNDCKGNLTLETSDAGIRISNLQGCVLLAKNKRGTITVKGATTIEVAETSNADVTAEISSVREKGTTLMVDEGSISLYLASAINADIEMKTYSGDIVTHSFGGMTTSGDSTEGYVKGTIGSGGYDIYLETSKGNIELFRLEATP